MDLFNVLINKCGYDIRSVKDLVFSPTNTTSFYFSSASFLTRNCEIIVSEKNDLYFIIGLMRGSDKESIFTFSKTLLMDGLSKAQLFVTMQQIANRTFIEDTISLSNNITLYDGIKSIKELEVDENRRFTDGYVDWNKLDDDERKAIWMVSKLQFLNKDPFKNFEDINTDLRYALAKFPETGNDFVLLNTYSALETTYSALVKNAPESLINKVSSNDTNKKRKTDFKLKDISDDLLKIAMMPKETRVVGVLNLKLLVDDLDEDDVPKEQIDLLKSIVDDLTDEIKYPTKGETNIEEEVINDDLELDLCALNDMLDNAFDVDNIDELNSLLDCEVQKEVTESKDMSYAEQEIYQKEKNLILDYKMDLGYRTWTIKGVYEEDIINRDIVDEVTGFVIPIRMNTKTKVLYPFDNEQLQRWENWGLV